MDGTPTVGLGCGASPGEQGDIHETATTPIESPEHVLPTHGPLATAPWLIAGFLAEPNRNSGILCADFAVHFFLESSQGPQ